MIASDKTIILHLSLIDGVGPAIILKLLAYSYFEETKKFCLEDLYKLDLNSFVNEFNLSPKAAKMLLDGLSNKTALEEELSLIQKYNIDLVTLIDAEYSQNLLNIHLPPPVLYCKGTPISSYEKNIAIVGSRNSNCYARQVIEEIIPDLIANQWTIVSGGALGVDSIAHETTIECGGKTIVVLGSGLLCPYPSENKKLFEKVSANNGTLLSIFPLKTKPFKGNFPARNRVISGLSDGCVVVQAAKKSGALITSAYALEQGRQVFAVPGPIFDELSVGCNELISSGAKLVMSANSILEEFGESNSSKEKTIQENREIQDPILDALQESLSIDELGIRLNLDFSELQSKLFEFQLEGKVEQDFAGFWKRI